MSVATYEDVKNLPANTLLIDVREPSELKETGELPKSINIPLGQLETAFNLSADDFKNKFGCPKPGNDYNMIFSCKAGGRAERAMKAIEKMGYTNLQYYKGSWLDWAEKSKQ